MKVENTNKGPMETNIDPHLQEDESTAKPVEELVEIQQDPNESSYVIKIGKGLSKELAQQLTEFLCHNQDVFAWMHADMIGIHQTFCQK